MNAMNRRVTSKLQSIVHDRRPLSLWDARYSNFRLLELTTFPDFQKRERNRSISGTEKTTTLFEESVTGCSFAGSLGSDRQTMVDTALMDDD